MALLINSVVKLGVAAVLGGIVGLEREVRRKPAGLRTNVLICSASALIMIISEMVPLGRGFGDPGRIAAQVVTGIGFLGAGAIVQSRGSVIGLTTGASIFMVAAIGLAVGAGYWIPATVATAIAVLSLWALSWLEKLLQTKARLFHYVLTTQSLPEMLTRLDGLLDEFGLAMEEVSFERRSDGFQIAFGVSTVAERNKELRNRLLQLDGVTKVAARGERE
jgi:putative Mg2+ transporter-C (MgtC) family protein